MRVGIVGCGLIGTRRAHAALDAGDTVVIVADVNAGVARAAADAVGSAMTVEWNEVVASDVEAVVVSTPNRELMPIGVAALDAGKHVLCEKPLGRNAGEARLLVEAARRTGLVLKTGFNHRHHPAIARAHSLADDGAIGRLVAVRCAYGHGGRPGYEQEWRGDPEVAGGGELLDQGVHLVDLSRWFLGDFSEATGIVATWFWPIEPLEDNAFAFLRTPSGAVASLHTSWTQWRNLFRFEVFGLEGYLVVEGLGGSYETERLRLGRRPAAGGRPDETEWSFPGEDVSWLAEWHEFKAAIAERRDPLGSGEDGCRAAVAVDAIYESARTGRTVALR
jgi:predicted dehydrogenase